ncbi:fimbrial protein [Siccibacter turicensis]|uniref:fimbrial protein n=1 Tax=Siccibacter turicensis TaxID=357233 RepID=UPI003F571B1A
MKKIIITTHLSVLLILGVSDQAALAEDVATSLAITGSVTQSSAYACSLYLNKSAVALLDNTSKMIAQDENGTGGANIFISIGGNSHTNECKALAAQGKLAFKFVGLTDDAEGTVLRNNDNTFGAAQGVGVGVFNGDDKFTPLKINKDTLNANAWGNTIIVQMVKLNGQTVKAGSVKSSLTVQFERL